MRRDTILLAIAVLVYPTLLLLSTVARHYHKPKPPAHPAANTYAMLHMPLYNATGDIESDIYAETATWDRTTGVITFTKPVAYQYRGKTCVRVMTGDQGKTRLQNGWAKSVKLFGHVRVRTYK